jgi:AcrR family transcriptional regulator
MSTRPRRPLTRERIVAAGVSIADKHGLGGVSMRKVAAKLGCEVMSLYNHVSNKDDLLADMLDQVYAEIPPMDDSLGWRLGVRTNALAARDALVGHPWCASLLAGTFPGPARRQHMEGMLRSLALAGLPEDVADLGFHAVTVHVQGFSLQQIGFGERPSTMIDAAERFLASEAAADHPLFVAHLDYHAERGHRHDDFTFVLDLILDGLERAASR